MPPQSVVTGPRYCLLIAPRNPQGTAWAFGCFAGGPQKGKSVWAADIRHWSRLTPTSGIMIPCGSSDDPSPWKLT